MHPEFLSMALFWIVAAYTPGPNNVVASYSGFNFGIRKTIPHIFGVTFGFTSVVFALTIGLVNVFKLFPIIQTILKYLGSLFLIYLAYKISFSKSSNESKNENPISLPKSTSITNEGFLAFSFFLTEITVPTLMSTLSKVSYVICSFINAVFILIISYEYRSKFR